MNFFYTHPFTSSSVTILSFFLFGNTFTFIGKFPKQYKALFFAAALESERTPWCLSTLAHLSVQGLGDILQVTTKQQKKI